MKASRSSGSGSARPVGSPQERRHQRARGGGGVRHPIAEYARGVEARRERNDAEARPGARARLERGDAAIGGRAADRARGLRAETERHHAGRHHGGRTRARPARRVVEIVRVAGRRRPVEIGELGGVRLAEDDGAGGAQLRDHLRVDGAGPGIGAGRAAGARRPARDVDHVLDRDRNAVQRAAQAADRGFRVQHVHLRHGAVAVDQAPALHQRLDRLDAAKAGFEHGTRVDLAVLQRLHDARDRAGIGNELFGLCRHAFALLCAVLSSPLEHVPFRWQRNML